MMRRLKLGAMTLLTMLTMLMVIGFAGNVSATIYGDFTDPTGTVSYLNVADVNGLYLAPQVSLNSLDFTPTNFIAECSACPGGVTTTDNLTLAIQATGGQQISEIRIDEGLDYDLASLDFAGFAAATVGASIFVDITEINGQSVNGINANVAVTFTPSFNVSVNGFGFAQGTILGTTGAIDIQQIIFNATGATGEATRLTVSLVNTLQAFQSGAGGSAMIQKRDTDFLSLTINGGNPIPEPSTALMLMGGLAALARRRRRSA